MPGTRTTLVAATAAFAVLIGVPFLTRLGGDSHASDGRTLIVVTPHVQQIQDEFARGFSDWHERVHGEPVYIDYRIPGGTSEIRRQLEAEYKARLADSTFPVEQSSDRIEVFMEPGTIGADLMFGGGSYDHGTLARGVEATVTTPDGETFETRVPMAIPAGLTPDELDTIFGDNRIGTQTLYDPDQYWIGTALSSFGIISNNDVLDRLGVPTPTAFEDLTDPRLFGWVALADPRQSGSITTTFDSILGNYGWDGGWRILREMCGNARYFTAQSTKPPADVSAGDAAVGLAIDFYGRGQAQTVAEAGDPDRVTYIDPPGEVYIDADPITILRGGPDPEPPAASCVSCSARKARPSGSSTRRPARRARPTRRARAASPWAPSEANSAGCRSAGACTPIISRSSRTPSCRSNSLAMSRTPAGARASR